MHVTFVVVAILAGLYFVVSLFIYLHVYNYGKMVGAKQGTETISTVTTAYQIMFGRTIDGTTEQIGLLKEALSNKDTIIASFQHENTELRQALEDVKMHADMLEDEDDDDDDDVVEEGDDDGHEKREAVQVAVSIPGVDMVRRDDRSAAKTSLLLYDKLNSARTALESVKAEIPTDAYVLLASMLDNPGEKSGKPN